MAPVNRRDFLRLSAATTSAAAVAAHLPAQVFADDVEEGLPGGLKLQEATIAQLQSAMAGGKLSARSLVERYIARIRALDQHGPHVNSVLELNPDAPEIADKLDEERRRKGP
ncbi:MAG: twin-arginine translocation signal domain-containing protein, partial [Candidatus Dormibacteraeota bacterium]|nr:twin-arginine translocation signal domain-containing protein [Candidatus Dormibacteraeota bacterium]